MTYSELVKHIIELVNKDKTIEARDISFQNDIKFEYIWEDSKIIGVMIEHIKIYF